MRFAAALVLGFLTSRSLISAEPATQVPAVPKFETDIRPIFREYCFDCHGASASFDGGLDLRLVRFLQKGGESGPAVVAGDVASSYLLDRIKNGEMPPGGHVPASKIETIERWIAAGAPTLRPEPETIGPGVPISAEERAYWAYQPIARPQVPSWPEAERVRTPIDSLLRKAMPAGLAFSPDADRQTLIRRLYIDLIGLPPTADELVQWTTRPGDRWYEELIDHLLQSPHYGERWARHWLDVAGYADSDGYTLADAERPWAWKYRDYVIRSLGADKPFDRFIAEQLAGDELAGPQNGDWTAEQIELLTATGFLRMAADGTGSGDNSPEARNKVIADTIKIVGSSLMGTSLACAQCHDHRYDPISHTDYFAVRAVFEPALDWQNWKIPGQRLVSLSTAAERQKAAEIEEQARKIGEERAAKQAVYMKEALDKELAKYEEPLRGQLRSAYETADKDRTPEQKELLMKNPSVNISPGVLYQYLPAAAEDLKTFDQKMAEIRATKPPEEFLQVLNENPGQAPATKRFHRGDFQQPKEEVAPAGLTVAAPEGERTVFAADDPAIQTTGRRLAFARWLTDRKNPLVARTLVNRIWMHHFGRGIVSTPGEFGKLGDTPTHPELLDWLAAEFVENGWSLKHLHRVILTSTAWRQSAVREPGKDKVDPDNRFYWRKSLQRLDAEIIRDRMLAASGNLSRDLFGPPVSIKEDETGQVIVDGANRRSLYVRVRRTQPVAMLQSFDAPVMETNCEYRPSSTVATQSLILLNGEFSLKSAGMLADRAIADSQALTSEQLAAYPAAPPAPSPTWRFGHGVFDEAAKRTGTFTDLAHWTGSQWQGGAALPDPTIGWVLLHPQGGHPGNTKFAAIRRWTAPAAGTVQVTGALSHGSENGDGVRSRVVSSAHGPLGEWTARNGKADTKIDSVVVQADETLDLITDCIANENSDSFTWTAHIVLTTADGARREFDSAAQFHGPGADGTRLPAQIAQAWRLALGRDARPEEMTLALQFAARQLHELAETPRGVAEGSSPPRQVLVNLSQMLLNSNEFLYVD
jgi:hypothetical protein